jgi:hypothetical protein
VEHYEARELPSKELAQFAVSGGATSVTVTINAATISLPNGNPITICDTPGFGDTKGVEMEIANGLGIIHALKKAKSVRPVLVFDREGMSTSRFTLLRKTLQIVIAMMGKQPNFSACQYIFTRCDQKKRKNVHKQLSHFRESRRENPEESTEDDVIFDALLDDMIRKTNPLANNVELDDEEAAPETLERLWGDDETRLANPENVFCEFISTEASDKLNVQVNRMLARMHVFLENGDRDSFHDTLRMLGALAETLCLPLIVKALESGKEMGRKFIGQIGAGIGAVTDHMLETHTEERFSEKAKTLREKLLVFSQMESISKACQMPVGRGYENALKSNTEKLLRRMLNEIEAVAADSDQTLTHLQAVLQNTLLRLDKVIQALEGLVKVDELREPVLCKISDLMKFQLTTAEQDLQEPTADGLKSSQERLTFLFRMTDYLLDAEDFHNNSTWHWLKQGLQGIENAIAGKSQLSATKLAEHTLDEDVNEPTWYTSLENLHTDCEVVKEHREFLLALSSFPSLIQKVNRAAAEKEDSTGQDPEATVAIFDGALSKALGNLAETCSDWTSKKQERSKKGEAEKLLKHVVAGCKVCQDHNQTHPKLKEDLIRSEVELMSFLEKCNAVPQRPDNLLYGPEELGKAWHTMLLQLRSFKIKHGHCNVSQKDPKNKKLGLVSYILVVNHRLTKYPAKLILSSRSG